MSEKEMSAKAVQNICGKLCLPLFIIIIICMLIAVLTAESSQSVTQAVNESSFTTEEALCEITETVAAATEAAMLSETAFAYAKRDDIPSPYCGLYEADTLTAIYEKEAQTKIHPASLTKILTAITALSYVPSDTVFTVGSEQELVPARSSLCLIKKGHKLTLYQLISGMLIASGGDAAYTIAVNTARFAMGTADVSDKEALSYFVGLMNSMAETAGAQSSNFINPDGFDCDGQYTTVRDLALIGSYAMHFKEISEIVRCAVKYVVFRSGENVTWKNSNQLLHSDSPYYYPNAIGMKTGTTALAGKCLMAVAEIEGKTYIAVVSGCSSEESRYSSALSLFEIIAPI